MFLYKYREKKIDSSHIKIFEIVKNLTFSPNFIVRYEKIN